MMKIGMSTSCVYPLGTERAFAMAKYSGFDGIEVMITQDPITQDAAALSRLSARYSLPILSVHAPVLLLTQFVWGSDPQVKLERSVELADAIGAATVVVHPPFRFQSRYARRFLELVRELNGSSGVEIAVENMFTWSWRDRPVKAYAPGWDPTLMDCDAVTLDFSHAALSGRNSLEMAVELGPRLRHIHLCDGSSPDKGKVFDEHLLPGAGDQPVAETLSMLAASGWKGSVIAEVNTRRGSGDADRVSMLRRTLEFAREHTRIETAAPRVDSAL